VNYNSSDFILNTLYCLQKITKNKYKVVIRDNNSKLRDFENLKKKIKIYPNVELFRIENFKHIGSMAHGIAVNDLINKIDTKYGVILDADCTFLYNDWDEILINEINDKYPIIGTQGSLHPESTRKADFPILIGVLFITDILKMLNIDFRPNSSGDFKDTGYELEKNFTISGYKGKILVDKNTRYFKDGPFHEILCTEYYLEGHRGIFMCHFGRGSTLGKAKYLKGWLYKINLVPFIGSKVLKSIGKHEKKKWIRICKNIINSSE